MDTYFKSIDKLRTKVDKKKNITLREACWVLWAEMFVCSTQYLDFQKWCQENDFTKNKTWEVWKALFGGYLEYKLRRILG